MERNLIERRNLASALGAFTSAINALGGLAADLSYLESSITGTTMNVAGWRVNNLLDNIEDWFTDEKMYAWFYPANQNVVNQYIGTQNAIIKAYGRCPKENDKDKEDDDDFDGDGSKPKNDPSGYVYEAVTSNRLEGVTVTCYQKVQKEDMYGDITEEAVVWNAEDYSQQNPLKTDETGFYRWDVPQGMWQVKYEKEGYETTYSDWLPVPPPQLDVNISMKQTTPPSVKQMRGYESGITIELSKYMLPETMTTERITVTRNGKDVKGTIELLNAEKAPIGGETYVSKVKFVPNNRFSTSDVVVVTVHKEVESYCGVKMTADHIETVKIEPEVNEIVVDNELTVVYQGKRELRVQVLPKEASAGKTLHVKTSSEMILSVDVADATIDQDGAATLMLSGELPGGAVLDFRVEGSDVTATSKVKVVINNTVATPIASIASGSMVETGTEIFLSCETAGATIYYTLDGSCPCVNTEARKVYDGTPITIEKNTVIKAMAAAPDMGESEVATFVYIVTNGDLNDDDKVDIADGVTILNIMAAGRYEEFADVNHDDKVDIADFVTVLNIMAQQVTPDTHEYVDLGLPSGTLWATCNVGASSPEEYGDYFAWGETTGYNSGKTDFTWSTYKYCKGTEYTLTKYCTNSGYGTVDNRIELEPEDDAATANWGSAWQMPSIDQIKELYNSSYTITEWTTLNGKHGRKITSKSNGKSIFLPAAGYRSESHFVSSGSEGYYWTRSLNASYSNGAYYLSFNSGYITTYYYNNRYYGPSVRPVRVSP